MIECADPAVCAQIAERQREIVATLIPWIALGVTAPTAGLALWQSVAVSRDS